MALLIQPHTASMPFKKPTATSKMLHKPLPMNSTARQVPSQRYDTAEENKQEYSCLLFFFNEVIGENAGLKVAVVELFYYMT